MFLTTWHWPIAAFAFEQLISLEILYLYIIVSVHVYYTLPVVVDSAVFQFLGVFELVYIAMLTNHHVYSGSPQVFVGVGHRPTASTQ